MASWACCVVRAFRRYVTPNYMNIRGLRIALFTGAYNHIADGVSLTLNRLVAFLEREGATVQVFAPTIPDPPLKHAGTLVPVPSISAPGRPEYRISLGLSRRANNSLTDFDPHLFHVATPDLPGLAALRTARRTGKPVVASYHTHFASYLTYYRLGLLEGGVWRYLRWFYSQCRQVYVPTASMISVLESHGIDGNLRLWPRGVESDLFSPAKRSPAWRHARGIGDSEIVILFVSRLVTEKGLDVLVDVVRSLESRGIAHRCVVVGDGPERSRLEASLPNAIFEGHQSGEPLATAYASSDVFLFPSDTETFGNVTLEALASGLPAVVADATGSNALVNDGVNGFLAPPRNSKAFEEKVERLIVNDELRWRMSAQARAGAERFEWNRILSQIVTYYGELE
jgi:phosphatidylinositol alpha 1,6-mannosyltransferase